MGVGEAVVPGVVAEILHLRVLSREGCKADGPLDEGPRGGGGAFGGDGTRGGVGGVEVEGADQVDGRGAGEARGQVPRRGGREAEDAPAIRRAAGGGDGEQEKAEEHERGAPTGGPHGWSFGGVHRRTLQSWGKKRTSEVRARTVNNYTRFF